MNEPYFLDRPTHTNQPTPWFNSYPNNNPNLTIAIIGGGISGTSTAYSLAKRGYKVTLYEQDNVLAGRASGNYQAMLYGSFSAFHSPIQELSLSGYNYSRQLIQQLLSSDNEEYAICGLIQLGFNAKEIKAQHDLIKSGILPENFCYIVNKQQIKKLANIAVNYPSGIYFPDSLWLNPPSLVAKLVSSPNINVMLGHNIDEIQPNNGAWEIIKGGKIINCTANVVLCNADSASQFSITKNLNIRKIRGQISIAKGDITLKTILCGPGYITPSRLGSYTMGATFDFKNIHTEVTLADHQQNLNSARLISSSLDTIEINNLSGQAAIRASTYDYMPLVGPIANYSKFKTTYAKLTQDKNFRIEDKCPYYDGLFLNIAHGAKGMLTAPICGEIIADYIANTQLPCSEVLRMALHPNRTYLRELVKNFK